MPRLQDHRDVTLYWHSKNSSVAGHDLSWNTVSPCHEVIRSLPKFQQSISSHRCPDYGVVGLDCRPGGRRTGRAPFFDETGMSHRKIPTSLQTAGLNWTWNVFFGYFLDSRLWRSPFGTASPFAPLAAQCAKESNSRTSAKKIQALPAHQNPRIPVSVKASNGDHGSSGHVQSTHHSSRQVNGFNYQPYGVIDWQ